MLLPCVSVSGKGEAMLGAGSHPPSRDHPVPPPQILLFPDFQSEEINSDVMFMVNLKSSTC